MSIQKFVQSVVGLVLVLAATQSSAFANCNYSCTVAGPELPCPTWSEPLRMCPTSFDDPTCLARRSLCQGTFAACVTAALTSEGAGAACVAGVIADFEAGGSITTATVALCGLAAEAVQQAANNCN